MSQARRITVYSDYKSPYAFLAKDRVYRLAEETGAAVDWLPYALDVPAVLGTATIAEDGSVAHSDRTPHHWRRIRYMFMDCRRQARRLGLTLRATQKVWGSRLSIISQDALAAGEKDDAFSTTPKQASVAQATKACLAAAGMLYAQAAGDTVFRRYRDAVFERFWKRALDIEDTNVLAAVLEESGADTAAFDAFAPEGLRQVATIGEAAEAAGVFGVPSFIVGAELFWGSEHLPDIREMLMGLPA